MPEPPLLEQALTLSCGETRVTNVSWVEGRQARNFKIPCTCCLATYHCRDDPRNHRAAGQFPAPRVYSPRPRRIRIDERIDVEQRRGRFSADFTSWKRHCRPRPPRPESHQSVFILHSCAARHGGDWSIKMAVTMLDFPRSPRLRYPPSARRL